MTIEFIGFLGFQHGSEIHPPAGPPLDAAYVERLAIAHDEGGFDRALVAFYSTAADSIWWPPTPPPSPAGSAS
jgi:alkanesulfonate monooxygenase